MTEPKIGKYGLPGVIQTKFDRETWMATEACLSVHATLLIENAECLGLLIEGPSGAGKTTVIRFFEGDDTRQFYRSDDITPASFVSHNASMDEEQLEEVDLLPKVRHKTLLGRDMASWFAGSRERIGKNMATMANVMDGDGFTRNTGAQGERGYTGDYRFNFLGATTPLDRRAWNIMGHVGNRFLFFEKQETKDAADVIEDVFEGSEYPEKVEKCRNLLLFTLNELWTENGGYDSVTWPEGTFSDSHQDNLAYLAKLVQHGRAPVTSNEDVSGGGEAIQEGPHRILSSFRNLARGRALLDGRRDIRDQDVAVCARVALSTMHARRRPLVRFLVDPENPVEVKASQVEEVLDVARPTARKRMELLDTLGIGKYEKRGDNQTSHLELREEFRWPSNLPYPG